MKLLAATAALIVVTALGDRARADEPTVPARAAVGAPSDAELAERIAAMPLPRFEARLRLGQAAGEAEANERGVGRGREVLASTRAR